MGRGRFNAKPTGRRNFSTPEDMAAGSFARPRTFRQNNPWNDYRDEESDFQDSDADYDQSEEED